MAYLNGEQRAVKLHDYKGIYSYPWLYECVLYNLLGCKTPEELCKLIKSTFLENNINSNKIKMLEMGEKMNHQKKEKNDSKKKG